MGEKVREVVCECFQLGIAKREKAIGHKGRERAFKGGNEENRNNGTHPNGEYRLEKKMLLEAGGTLRERNSRTGGVGGGGPSKGPARFQCCGGTRQEKDVAEAERKLVRKGGERKKRPERSG